VSYNIRHIPKTKCVSLLLCATKGGEKLETEENGQRAHQTEDEKRGMGYV